MLQRAACFGSLIHFMNAQAAFRRAGSLLNINMLPPPEGGANCTRFGIRPRPHLNFTFFRMNACEPVECQIIVALPAANSWGPSLHGVNAGVARNLFTR